MKSLLDMRRGENMLKKRTLIINLSNEAKSNMNVAGRLKVPAFVNHQADYSRIIDEQYSYELTMEVQF